MCHPDSVALVSAVQSTVVGRQGVLTLEGPGFEAFLSLAMGGEPLWACLMRVNPLVVALVENVQGLRQKAD